MRVDAFLIWRFSEEEGSGVSTGYSFRTEPRFAKPSALPTGIIFPRCGAIQWISNEPGKEEGMAKPGF